MRIDELKYDLKSQFVKGIEIVLTRIDTILSRKSSKYNEFLILQASFFEINKSKILNTETNELLSTKTNKLMQSVLGFIDSLSEEDLIEVSGNKIFKNKENFSKYRDWQQLLKIGDWKYFQDKEMFVGEGIYKYILSRNIYGEKSFTINTNLKFSKVEEYLEEGIDNMNSGIIFGWREEEDLYKYYNILITGRQILLEQVGFNTGDEYRDFEHLDEGFEFEIEDNQVNKFSIRVSNELIDVFIDNRYMYSFRKQQKIIGRIGLRPWRGKLESNYFEIVEK